MPQLPYNLVPWCTGRTYPNAPPAWKHHSLTRPPPYFWIINKVAGGTFPCEPYPLSVLRPYTWTEGANGNVSWAWYHADETMHFPTYRLFWRAISFTQRDWFLQVTPCGSGVHFQEWRSAPFGPVNDWRSFDGLVFSDKTNQNGSWPYGDTLYQLQVGEYSRLPAHSCRGDYGGEWP